MKAVGITAEYNPLHNGHVYHIKQSREISGCDAVVVAMSGDFVQRGAPAVFDKWKRAEHVLRNGADLVVEIPVLYCLGNAGQYASAGVRLLESLGVVTHIAFGSESGDIELISNTAEFLNKEYNRLEDEIRILSRQGLSFPAARTRAYEMLGGNIEGLKALENPNDILAVEYIRYMKSAVPVAIRRIGASYGQGPTDGIEYQSASGIRDIMCCGGDASAYVPDCVDAAIRGTGSDKMEENRRRLFDMIRYAIISTSPEYIDDCPSGGEGLGNILRSEIGNADSLEDLILRAKSRRYTYTRISRLLMQVLLGITRAAHYTEGCRSECPDPGYIRVLGSNDTGRRLLAEIRNKGSASLPVITNINKERNKLTSTADASLELDIHAADVYSIICGADIADNNDRRMRLVLL